MHGTDMPNKRANVNDKANTAKGPGRFWRLTHWLRPHKDHQPKTAAGLPEQETGTSQHQELTESALPSVVSQKKSSRSPSLPATSNPLAKNFVRRNTNPDSVKSSVSQGGSSARSVSDHVKFNPDDQQRGAINLARSHMEMLQHGIESFRRAAPVSGSVLICPAVSIASAGVIHLMIRQSSDKDAARLYEQKVRKYKRHTDDDLTLQCLAQTSSEYLLYTASGIRMHTITCLLRPAQGTVVPTLTERLRKRLRNYYHVDSAAMDTKDLDVIRRYVNEWGQDMGDRYMEDVGTELVGAMEAMGRGKDGKEVSEIPMMHQVNHYKHAVHLDKKLVIVGIPVGRGGKSTAFFILPIDCDFSTLEENMTAAILSDILQSTCPYYMSLSLPRFRIRGCLCLSVDQYLPGMCEGVYHYCDVKVDEVGIELPSQLQSSVSSNESSVDSSDLVIDGPFLFVVQVVRRDLGNYLTNLKSEMSMGNRMRFGKRFMNYPNRFYVDPAMVLVNPDT